MFSIELRYQLVLDLSRNVFYKKMTGVPNLEFRKYGDGGGSEP